MWRWDDERYHFSVRLCVDTAPLAVILMSFNIITHLGLKTLWRACEEEHGGANGQPDEAYFDVEPESGY